jgi:hypothetical protein
VQAAEHDLSSSASAAQNDVQQVGRLGRTATHMHTRLRIHTASNTLPTASFAAAAAFIQGTDTAINVLPLSKCWAS